MQNEIPQGCYKYQSPSIGYFLFSVFLVIAIAGSYIPQHLKIIRRKSAEGISPLFLLLGTTSSISALTNLILVGTQSFSCCFTGLSIFECVNGQLGLLQVGIQAIFAALILVFCIYCTRNSIYQDKGQYDELYRFYKIVIIYGCLHIIAIVFLLLFMPTYRLQFANTFGLISTGLASFQYFPQIYTVYKLKHPGSLSIEMMLMQTPGGFIWSLSLMLRPGSIWSSWLPYFSAAFLQSIVLTMCIYYSKNNGLQDEGPPLADEQTSLLYS